jgi:hypothetical protein
MFVCSIYWIYDHHPVGEKKVNKGTWGMPRLWKAKKDVISCDKLRGLANTNRSADFRMGQPDMIVSYHSVISGRQTWGTETSKYP